MQLARVRRRRLGDDRGTSLVEIAVTMGLMGLVGSLLMASLATSQKANSQVDDQHRGLADLEVVTERMSRDLRVARGVDPLATTSQLTLWIDTNSDYKRETDESVTWRIRCRTGVDCATTSKQYDVERVVGAVATGAVTVVGQTLVSDIAFAYVAKGVTVAPEAATAVRVEMDYDAVVGTYSKSKKVKFEVRLRNVQ